MSRSPITRLCAFALAVAFHGAAVGDALGFHRCPHHDAVPAPRETSAAASPQAPHHHGHAADTSAGPQRAPQSHSGHGESHGPCTCVGMCQAGGVTGFTPVEHATPTLAVREVVVVRAVVETITVFPTPVAHLLPFANAPPLLG